MVTAVLEDTTLVCQLYSWVDGRPTSIVLVNIEEVKTHAPFNSKGAHWDFYQDREEWLETGARETDNMRERRREKRLEEAK